MSTSFTSSAAATAEAELFERHLSRVYALTQQNRHVFASPLGPVAAASRQAWMPRFVFFGPNTTDESWRLAFLAGFDHRDLRASQALLGLVEFLAENAGDGYGLNLTFFPLVDVAGLASDLPPRPLATAHWGRFGAAEISLLERDARLAGYHGFVRVETAAPGDDMASLRMRAPGGLTDSPDVELVTSADFDPYPVRFEREDGRTPPADGPLSVADDFPVPPFELTLRIPAAWAPEPYQSAVNAILGRFILRYRAFQAFGQHL